MSASVEFLINRLRDQGEKTIQFFRNISPDKWDVTIYSDGSQWTTHQVLCHFAQAESSLCRLVEQIAGGGQSEPEDFNLDAYNEYKVSIINKLTEDELIKLFNQNRQKTIDFVSQLTESDLEKRGWHPYLGMAALVDIIKLIYRHNQIHIREIRGMLS